MLLTWIYRAIALLICAFVAKDFWDDNIPSAKVCACMVMVPLALRILMIK